MNSLKLFSELNAGEEISAEAFATAEMKPPYRYERVKGRLVVKSPAGPEHRHVSKPFRRGLGLYWGQHPDIVDDIDVEGWVATSEETDRIPDICVYLCNPAEHNDVPQRVPDLIFEFVSAHRSDQERDYNDKRAEYHEIGVREYVIVDRFKQSALQLAWHDDDFTERTLAATDTYSTPLLPGLNIPLSEAFS